jgi:Protein of unknown function (DUF1553)/Protein of unknown function (DUF1549)
MVRKSLLLALLCGFGLSVSFAQAPKKLEKAAEKAEAAKKAAQAAQAKKHEEERLAAEAKKANDLKKAAVAKEQKELAGKFNAVQSIAAGKQDVAALAKQIDTRIQEKLTEKKIPSSDLCSDEEFLRRASLDIAGVIPTLDRTKAFLESKESDKRAKLIDELLASENYGRKQADIWLAKLYPKDSSVRFVQPAPFYDWIKGEFNKNTGWDKFVSTIIDANGSVDEHPEVTFYLANRTIDKLTDTTTQHFLGVRLGCAQCHNHPFTTTKQTEYWAMAAFFSKVQADKAGNQNKGADNTTLSVKEADKPNLRKDFFPESAKKVSAKFYDGAEPVLDAKEPYRPELAKWMTAKTNPLFAKAMANRTWSQLFGQGIVDPVDDMIVKNKPTHPELLDELAKHFAETGFDVKYLIRGICNSQTYQRSSKPTEANHDDNQYFSHQIVRQLSPEQLFDSMAQVLNIAKPDDKVKKADAKPVQKGVQQTERDRFATFYLAGAEEPSLTDYEAGIPQALRIMNSKNGPILGIARSLVTSKASTDAVIEKMYLTALNRKPTSAELKRLQDYAKQSTTNMDAYSDILWALLNSSEFSMIK